MALYAFNGTWNEEEIENDESKKRNTNVVKFRDAYIGEKFYLDGVGTRLGFIGKFLGGIPGAGGRIRIKEAKDALKRNFEKNDRVIDIIGFSRGAEIRFLGLWDVVASFGIPGNNLNFGWTLTLPDNVKKCCHAMALDECRGNFPLTESKCPRITQRCRIDCGKSGFAVCIPMSAAV